MKTRCRSRYFLKHILHTCDEDENCGKGRDDDCRHANAKEVTINSREFNPKLAAHGQHRGTNGI